MMIKITDYNELHRISWSIYRDNQSITEDAAFRLYQSNWRLVDVEKMDEAEWLLLLRLVEQFGPIKLKYRKLELGTIDADYLREIRSGKIYIDLSAWEGVQNMTWNYRVFMQVSPTETTYQIYEVYYDDQDNIHFVSDNPKGPFGVTFEEISNDLEHMRQALKLPILDLDAVLKTLEESGAADHDKWFREQVAEGIREADDPNTVWVSNEEVKAMSASRRAEWKNKAKAGGAKPCL